MMNLLKNAKMKSLALALLSSAVLFIGSGAQAVYISTDTQYGGTIANKTNTAGNFHLVSQNMSRAEFRYRSINNGTLTLGGKMRLVGWNLPSESGADSDRISLLQVLNNESGTSGAANPISQLTIRKSPTSANPNRLVFYIITGGSGSSGTCSGWPYPVKGTTYTVSVSVAKGGSPTYKVNGTNCTKVPADGDRAGTIGSTTGKYYYGKLGAYVTGGSSNTEGANGNGVNVRWTELTDY